MAGVHPAEAPFFNVNLTVKQGHKQAKILYILYQALIDIGNQRGG